MEIRKRQAGFALFPEQQQLSLNKHSQEHEALKLPHAPPPPSHIYTHHNSCYIKAVITTASWLSISVYLWCITHFNAILLQRLSCHCSVYGWEKKKAQTTNGCNIQYVVPWEQRTNECSAPSKEQQFRVINSIIPPSRFNLVYGYALERGLGGVMWSKGRATRAAPKVTCRGFRGVLTSFSISVIMSRSGCCKAGGGKGKANVQHWPEENHQICVL